ncbi:NADH-quinone oxidoreductase subunit C [Streptomyces sp. NBC_01351]|uniref:NADH-quinone oxidoreductase subunit C n=1 Tax=Streptomyces sp. NBC_01351 TaxID=2903833 RepID=UPI002E31B939|nr:NADH-quinone oxidoreductase subunit C [Streptomyces sp. NBC_01351]
MNLYDSLPDAAPTIFGEEAVGSSAYDLLTVDVPVGSWISSLEIARDKLGCTYFDWLSAVDEPGTGFRICAHVVSLENRRVRRLLLRTTVPHSSPSLPSAIAVYAGAEWHERETFEMFGVTFTDHPHLVHLLLPEEFEGHPLRKDFVLAARVAKAWPGAKEPGEAHDPDAPKRRQMLPPGVPDPNEWGPLKGQLPPAPTRPARTPRAAGAAAREGAPARRTRSVADGSATQATETPATEAPAATRPPRRVRSAEEGSASQATPPSATPPSATPPSATPDDTTAPETQAPARPPRRTRSVTDGSASQTTPDSTVPEPAEPPAAPGPEADAPAREPEATRPPRRTRSAGDGSASQSATPPEEPRRAAPRSADAPWHNPVPAFDEPATPATAAEPEPATGTEADGTPDSTPEPNPNPNPTPDNGGDA